MIVKRKWQKDEQCRMDSPSPDAAHRLRIALLSTCSPTEPVADMAKVFRFIIFTLIRP
jgi:hypothetical protein